MEAKLECDTSYYDFLTLIQECSKNAKKIQNKSMSIVYQNYDLREVKIRLNNEIAQIDKLLKE